MNTSTLVPSIVIDTNNEQDLRKESRAIFFSRSLVFFVLGLTTIVLGIFTAKYISESEHHDFAQQYKSYASELTETSQENVQRVFGQLEALSVAITAYSLNANTTWPLITIPYFEERAEKVRALSQALIVSFLPMVNESSRSDWEKYSYQEQGWLKGSLQSSTLRNGTKNIFVEPIPSEIFQREKVDGRARYLVDGCPVKDDRFLSKEIDVPQPYGEGPYAPVWQISPPPPAHNTAIINYNLFDKPVFKKAVHFISIKRRAVFLDVCEQSKWFGDEMPGSGEDLQTVVVQPVFENFDSSSNIVGHIVAVIPWKTFFENILPPDTKSVVQVIMSNTCNEAFSYGVQGAHAYLLQGETKIDTEAISYDHQYTNMEITSTFTEYLNLDLLNEEEKRELCIYSITIFPTESMEEQYKTNKSYVYAIVVVTIILFTSMVFLIHDLLLQRRQKKMREEKMKSMKHELLVSSLFPENVRDRVLFETTNKKKEHQSIAGDKNASQSSIKDTSNVFGSRPIAELYPQSTIMFGDIVGFTAWSSMREPSQVFTLLESVYHEFDVLAKQQNVFKVETVGDCYVAVVGVPSDNDKHALAMAKFACDCLEQFKISVSSLEVALGPDTGELALRIGLHSGPVTAGVLRGERARFQLFGDTVNTASRIESNGKPNRIHISEQTALELKRLGCDHMIVRREDKIVAKGKGEMTTYWLVHDIAYDKKEYQISDILTSNATTVSGEDVPPHSILKKRSDDMIKKTRLILWNVELLSDLLTKKIGIQAQYTSECDSLESMDKLFLGLCNISAVDEVREVIAFSNVNVNNRNLSRNDTVLNLKVKEQLLLYVRRIESLYNDNPFHNFEHATHVTMSVNKLFSSVTNTESLYGITSDPLTKFACVFSALVHDVGHMGVSNAHLMKEDIEMAEKYQKTCVAEQNSINLAWNTLAQPEFTDLRRCIVSTKDEMLRFRQILVNSVIATDIFDQSQCLLRKNRWKVAFEEKTDSTTTETDICRKATIVMEHMIQASDVAHTMQHFTIYKKWNTLLFKEMYMAYLAQRSDTDPSLVWYKGELWFFDNYVIPLAKKLQECQAFGVSSDEYLNYAVENRREWVLKGEQIVHDMVANITSITL